MPQFDYDSMRRLEEEDCEAALDRSDEYQTCNKCGRKTYDSKEFGEQCDMRQPDSSKCTGFFKIES